MRLFVPKQATSTINIILILLLSTVFSRQIVDKFQNSSKASELRKIASVGSNSDLSITGPLLSNLLIPRVSGTPGNLKVRNFIVDCFNKLGWSVELDEFEGETPFGIKKFANIIVTHDKTARKRMTLAAHYDSKYFADFEFIGATDSAAPCAILIHVAQTLTDALNRRKNDGNKFTTLQMIFFDGEEAFVEWTAQDSIYGARHLAEKWASVPLELTSQVDGQKFKTLQIEMMDALILLDLLGTKEISIPNSQDSTQWIWDRLVRIHEKLAMLNLLSPYMTERIKKNDYMFKPGKPTLSAYALQDDHVPFLKLGVPICHLIAVPFPKVWHTEADNAKALDEPTIKDLALTFRVLVSEYFGLIDYL